MGNIGIVICILSFVASTIIVNKAYRIWMKLIGSDVMFFSMKKKLIAIVIVGLLIAGTFLKLFGIA